MIKIKITEWFQVVEYTCAKQILYHAGMGQCREDADTLVVYGMRGNGETFHIPRNTTLSPLVRLFVDEGHYSNCMHLTSMETFNSFSLPWCEYVDAVDLMGAVVRRLVPDAVIRPSDAIGRGRQQQDLMKQYVAHLLSWTEKNPDNIFSFI